MKANLTEVAEILNNMQEADMSIKGIEYAFLGCSDLQFQYKFRGIEFYLSRAELERQCRNSFAGALTVWVKPTSGQGFYKILR